MVQVSGRGGSIPHEAAAMAAHRGLQVGKGAPARDRADVRYTDISFRDRLTMRLECIPPASVSSLPAQLEALTIGSSWSAYHMQAQPYKPGMPQKCGVQGRRHGCSCTSCRCWGAAPLGINPMVRPASRQPALARQATRTSPPRSNRGSTGAGGEGRPVLPCGRRTTLALVSRESQSTIHHHSNSYDVHKSAGASRKQLL